MLKTLGSKSIFFLTFLILLNVGSGAFLHYYLEPEAQNSKLRLEQMKAEVETRRQEVAGMKEEFILLQNQLRDFKELEARGFFNDQNRVAAQESFEHLRTLSGLLKAKYNIKPGQMIENPLAASTKHVVLKSAVEVEMESLDDVDVYSFVKFIQEKFPGSVDVLSIKLDRTELFNVAMLRQIGGGVPTPLVKARVAFDWRTMAPKDNVAPVVSSEIPLPGTQ